MKSDRREPLQHPDRREKGDTGAEKVCRGHSVASPVEYRQAIGGDLEDILRLYAVLNPEDEPIAYEKARSIWETILSDPALKYFVAYDSERAVGSCNISIIPNLTRGGRPYGVIENVITDPAYRRRGIGRRLMQEAIGYARMRECYKVILLSSMKRADAHKFYESIGFNGSSKKGFELRF